MTDAIQRTSRGHHRDDQLLLLLLLLLHSSSFEYLARGKRLASCLLGCGGTSGSHPENMRAEKRLIGGQIAASKSQAGPDQLGMSRKFTATDR